MERFMPLYDERAELAVRDLVARSIDDQLKKRHEKYALLDISCKPKEEISLPFSQYCFYVSPVCFGHNSSSNPGCSSCHYMCGGVQAGLQGETNVKGLYVAGEIACRGLHGANRLASNSLLEALVFARRAVQPSVDHTKGSSLDPTASNSWPRSVVPLSLVSNVTGKFMLMTKELRTELQPVMWDYVGIVPSTMRLETAEQRIGSLEAKWEECLVQNGWKPTMVGPESEMRNLFCCSKLVVSSAKKREPRTTLHRQFSSSRGE